MRSVVIDGRVLMDKYYSGVSEYCYNLTANLLPILREREVRTKIFYNSFKDIDSRVPNFDAEEVRRRYPNKVFNYIMQRVFKVPKLDKVAEADVFFMPHINFAAFSPSYDGLILAIHDLSFLRFPEFFSTRKNIWHRFQGLKKLTRRARVIIAISENTKADIVELLGVDEARVKVVYNGYDKNMSPVAGSDDNLDRVREEYGLPDRFALYMGNLEPRKNLETLVGAFDMAVGKSGMRDLHLVLAGNVGWKNKNIFRAIQAAKHKKKIHLLGYVRAEDRRYIYSLARMFVFPSFYEGFGIPPLESMACGTPVVASHTSSLGEVVGANGILIDPYDKKDLADAMRELNKDDDLCELLRRKGLERANNFSWKKAARQYFDIFENYG